MASTSRRVKCRALIYLTRRTEIFQHISPLSFAFKSRLNCATINSDIFTWASLEETIPTASHLSLWPTRFSFTQTLSFTQHVDSQILQTNYMIYLNQISPPDSPTNLSDILYITTHRKLPHRCYIWAIWDTSELLPQPDSLKPYPHWES